MLYILFAILLFGLLIAVHELGHFATAKILGVRVNEFSVGMGPTLWKGQKGETLYSLRALPIGGYCSMEGEDDDSADPRAFGKAKLWKKLVILSAGSFMNFVVGLLLVIIILAPSKAFFTPVIVGFEDAFPLQGEQGLQQGDRILSIDGEKIYLYADVTMFFSRSNGSTMDLVVDRSGEKVVLNDFPLTLREYTVDGKSVIKYGLYFGNEQATLGGKLRNSWYTTVDFVRMVRLSLGDLFSGAAGLRDLSGPVGIVDAISQVGNQSESTRAAVYNILYYGALIAVNLAVMNMLPLPALDGGRIFFLLINGAAYLLFKRKINPKYEGYVHMTGLALLMGLMLMVTFSDIGKLFGA